MAKYKIKVKPTRFELLKLKRKLEQVEKGASLLEKKHSLLLSTIERESKALKELRKEFEKELEATFLPYLQARAAMGHASMESASRDLPPLEIKVRWENIRGIQIPALKVEEFEQVNYSLRETNSFFDNAVKGISPLVQKYVEYVSKEHMIEILKREAHETMIRVNALEKVLIVAIKAEIKKIEGQIEELEIEEIARLKTVKEMLLAKGY